jgi:hypothetical protein
MRHEISERTTWGRYNAGTLPVAEIQSGILKPESPVRVLGLIAPQLVVNWVPGQ